MSAFGRVSIRGRKSYARTLCRKRAYIYAMGELSFLELRSKEIINSCDGRRLGRIIDLVFTEAGKVKGIVAPYTRRGLFSKAQDVYIPYHCIKKIGEDVILVDIPPDFCGRPDQQPAIPSHCPPPHDEERPPHSDGPECDMRCEKCMLFDCAYRWRDKTRR